MSRARAHNVLARLPLQLALLLLCSQAPTSAAIRRLAPGAAASHSDAALFDPHSGSAKVAHMSTHERSRSMGKRLKEHLPGEALVDIVLEFSAQLRYEVVARMTTWTQQRVVYVAGPSFAKAWGVYTWPDHGGRQRYAVNGPWEVSMKGPGQVSGMGACILDPENGVTVFELRRPLQEFEEFLWLGRTKGGGVDYASLVFARCTGIDVQMFFQAWDIDRCSEGLGWHAGIRTSELWPDGHCAAVVEGCPRIWSYSGAAANPHIPCWDDTLHTMSARLAPDGDSVLIHSTSTPNADYIWDFAEGLPPRILQEQAPTCVESAEDMLIDTDEWADISADGELYATRNATHVLAFDLATGGRPAFAVDALAERPSGANGDEEHLYVRSVEVWEPSRAQMAASPTSPLAAPEVVPERRRSLRFEPPPPPPAQAAEVSELMEASEASEASEATWPNFAPSPPPVPPSELAIESPHPEFGTTMRASAAEVPSANSTSFVRESPSPAVGASTAEAPSSTAPEDSSVGPALAEQLPPPPSSVVQPTAIAPAVNQALPPTAAPTTASTRADDAPDAPVGDVHGSAPPRLARRWLVASALISLGVQPLRPRL